MLPDLLTGLNKAHSIYLVVGPVLLHWGQLKSFIWQPWQQFKNLLARERYFFAQGVVWDPCSNSTRSSWSGKLGCLTLFARTQLSRKSGERPSRLLSKSRTPLRNAPPCTTLKLMRCLVSVKNLFCSQTNNWYLGLRLQHIGRAQQLSTCLVIKRSWVRNPPCTGIFSSSTIFYYFPPYPMKCLPNCAFFLKSSSRIELYLSYILVDQIKDFVVPTVGTYSLRGS